MKSIRSSGDAKERQITSPSDISIPSTAGSFFRCLAAGFLDGLVTGLFLRLDTAACGFFRGGGPGVAEGFTGGCGFFSADVSGAPAASLAAAAAGIAFSWPRHH